MIWWRLSYRRTINRILKTPSGKIEILNPQENVPLITYREPYGDGEPFWLIVGNDIRILDSSFCEMEFDDSELMKLRIEAAHENDVPVCSLKSRATHKHLT